jgi:hypothetical protein
MISAEEKLAIVSLLKKAYQICEEIKQEIKDIRSELINQ